MILHARQHRVTFPRRPLVMGIINLNDDSFCGDGSLDAQASLQQAMEQILLGADIVDIGAESARTNRTAITVEEEVRRLRAFMCRWEALLYDPALQPVDSTQCWPPLLSINTWRPAVAEEALALGGDILNDMGALPQPDNASLCAQFGAALVIMHSIGEPKVPHTHVTYRDVVAEVDEFFTQKIATAQSVGLDRTQIILDPGIDFAKQRDDNLALYRHLDRLAHHGMPLLLPVSRKTVIHHVLDQPDTASRDPGTVACIAAGMRRGASIFRVHNVAAAVQTVRVLEPLMGS